MNELTPNEIIKARLEMALARITELEKTNKNYSLQMAEMRKRLIQMNPIADAKEKAAGIYINNELLKTNTELRQEIEKLKKRDANDRRKNH